MITALVVMGLTAGSYSVDVLEAHDRVPTHSGYVTRAGGCVDSDAAGMNDGDRDCDDVVGVGVPVDGGWMPVVMLGAGGAAGWFYFARRRRGRD